MTDKDELTMPDDWKEECCWCGKTKHVSEMTYDAPLGDGPARWYCDKCFAEAEGYEEAGTDWSQMG